ncbi:MAG: response regulator transcription factor [Christensenellales bacterium]|nr:response regulator transcription factor [Christensenellales bacterium]
MVHVLVVEDDVRFNQIVCASLNAAGYAVQGCTNASEAFDALHDSGADIIISDIMMPGIDGFEFVEDVRRINKRIPILLMTARDDLSAKRQGFRAGIDDYMVKPIDLDELLLRIEALLRRARIEDEKRLTVGKAVLDAEEVSAYVDGTPVTLTLREFQITYKLLSYPRRTFSRAQLMDEFWSGETSASLRAVDVYITRIREKFSGCEDFKIVTVHGLGYKAVPNA